MKVDLSMECSWMMDRDIAAAPLNGHINHDLAPMEHLAAIPQFRRRATGGLRERTACDRDYLHWSGRTLLWRVGGLFHDMVFNYPTLAEAYKVAALDGLNKL
jgi:hypothetical protein